jgi:hypothetical protein
MDDTAWAPRLFANKVIFQFVQHILAEDMVVDPEDFLAIRVVFRWCGGSWAALADGDVVMLELIQKIVSAWGKMDGRKHESDQVV